MNLNLKPVPPEEIDPRLDEAQKRLAMLIMQRRGGEPLNQRLIRDLKQICHDFRETCKRKGVIFPKLTVVAFPSMNQIAVWPEELPAEEIQKRIRMMILAFRRRGRNVDPEEMAVAIRHAYPDYSPSTSAVSCPDSIRTN